MAWLRIDDRARLHPKIIQAGPGAAWLWFCGLSYSRELLTDGVIDKKLIGSLAVGLGKPRQYAKKLVTCGLWIDCGSHYQIHDFFDWNPSKADVIAQRNADSARKRPRAAKGEFQQDSDRNPNGIRPDSSHARAGDAGSGSGSGSGIEDLDLSEEDGKKKAKLNGTALEPVWNTSPRAHTSALVGRHTGCFEATPAACARGMCLPHWLGQMWRQQQGSDDPAAADRYIAGFVDWAFAQVKPGVVGDAPKTFWPRMWQEFHGSQAPPETRFQTKGNATVAAFNRFAKALASGRPQ